MSGMKRFWKLQEISAHGSNVNCLAFGRKSGRVMVTGGDDRKVNLWAVGQQDCIMSLSGHTTAVECVQFDPREVTVCAGSMSGALKIWDLEAAKIMRTLTGHKANVRCLDFHPYGDFIASGSLDTSIKLWDLRKKGCIYTYKAHNKAVNSLKFSPDGKWVASGGDEGSVKLWDLSAGKVLTEFTEHSGQVTGIEFHPNEFLLASGASDRTVKFWDLESFQLVSTTDGDCMPIRCICFHDNGKCLYSGSMDGMRVYSWEPSSTLDSVHTSWGKVADITVSQNQLISGTFSLNSISVHVVQLSTLRPFSESNNGTKIYEPSTKFASSSPHVRRNFIKDSTSRKLCDIDVKVDEMSSSPDDDVENDNLESAIVDSENIFMPRSELCRTPPKSDPFPVPLDDSECPTIMNLPPRDYHHSEGKFFSHEKSTFSSADIPEKLVPNSFKYSSPIKSQPISANLSPLKSSSSFTSLGSPMKNSYQTYILPTQNMCSTKLPPPPYGRMTESSSQNSIARMEYHMPAHQPTKPIETKSMASRRYAPEAVVRPTLFVPEKDSMPQRAVVQPEQLKTKVAVSDFVPQQRDKPAGLSIDEFMPKSLQASVRLNNSFQPEMSETEAMNSICNDHQQILSVLSNRCRKMSICIALLNSKGPKSAIETVVHMNDMSIVVDLLGIMNRRPGVWSLDTCQLLLPLIQELVQSKYESYMSVGCEALRVILRRFGNVIKTNVDAPPSIGVDLCGEERANKCKSCYENLIAIRSFILKRQTMQGELGNSFRELLKIMCNDFASA